MFTIKYRSYQLSAAQDAAGYPNYDEVEQIAGPYDLISKEMKGGYPVVHAHNGDDRGVTYGPAIYEDTDTPQSPRPVAFVMNESGATVATYRL